MTKNIFLLLFILFSALFFGQNFKTDVENQFRDYNSLISSKNFKKAITLGKYLSIFATTFKIKTVIKGERH